MGLGALQRTILERQRLTTARTVPEPPVPRPQSRVRSTWLAASRASHEVVFCSIKQNSTNMKTAAGSELKTVGSREPPPHLCMVSFEGLLSWLVCGHVRAQALAKARSISSDLTCCHPALVSSRVSAVSSHVTSVCPSLSHYFSLLHYSHSTPGSGLSPCTSPDPRDCPRTHATPSRVPVVRALRCASLPETATRGGTNTLMLRILTPCTATPALSSTLAQWQSSAALGVGRLGEGRPVAHLRCPARACLFAGVRLPAAVGLLRGTGFRIMHPHFPPCE